MWPLEATMNKKTGKEGITTEIKRENRTIKRHGEKNRTKTKNNIERKLLYDITLLR
jgi:hypothetical protein